MIMSKKLTIRSYEKIYNDENVYLDFLDPTELKRVMKVLVQVDQRMKIEQRLLHQKKLNPVSCLLLAFLLTTGRRTEEAITYLEPIFKR